jgi:class 3 adenylate cyclase
MAHGAGWAHPDYARNVAVSALAHTTQAEFEGAHRRNYHDDVTELLSTVECPTLVMYPEDSAAPLELGQRLAANIPGAQLRVFPGDSLIPELCAPDEIFDAMVEFLPAGSGSAHPDAASQRDGFRAILFTDVVASTPLLAQLKDTKMRDVMRAHDAVLDAAVAEHGGRVVKEIGDAFMVEFAIPSAAVECAIAIQRGIRDQFADSDVPIRLRIGINAGEPVAEDGDLHGASVNIAKRLESAAATNGILVSDVVKQAVVGKDFEFADQGEVALKGFDDPVHAWSVEWA